MKWLSLLPVCLLLMLGGCASLDPGDRAILAQHHVSPAVVDKMQHNEELSQGDVVELSKRGLPDPFIIRYMKSTYAVYQLTSSDVAYLVRAGVSRGVVDYMLATPSYYGPPRGPYWYDTYPYGPYPLYDYPPVIVTRPYYHPWRHW